MDTLLQDFRYALRQLVRSPGFAVVAVLTLALGIGANTAIFSVVNGVLLRPLPFPDEDALVQVVRPTASGRSVSMSPPDFLQMREDSRAFEDLAAFDNVAFTLTGDGEPLRVVGAEVSASLFDVLGVPPLLGRGFREEENDPAGSRVAVLGHALWQQRFGGDPEIVGRDVRLNDQPHTVVGVMPADFDFGAWELLTPLVYDETFRGRRGAVYLEVVGRMAPGFQLEQAAADLGRIAADLEAAFPESNTNRAASAISLKEKLVGDVRPSLLILLGAVGLVLLIACANVANLLLARGAAREGEMAVRGALGANRGRIVRQLLTESLLLAAAGGAAGLLLALWGTEILIALQPRDVPRLEAVTLDVTVVAFLGAAVLVTALLFGLLPAVHATRVEISGSMKSLGTGARNAGRGRLRAGLVVAEVGVAVMLLTGAGLLIKSFIELQRVDPGFQAESTVAFGLSLPAARYPEDHHRAGFYRDLLERVEAVPDVRSAGAVLGIPMGGENIVISFNVAGREPAAPGESPSLETRVATPDYFRTLGIPVLSGRSFSEQDREGAPPVVLINQAAAREFFPDEDPVGQRIDMEWFRDSVQVGGEIVGVVADVRQFGLDQSFVPEIYLPHAQVPLPGMTMVVRTASEPLSVIGSVRAELLALDPELPISNVRPLEQVLSESVSEPRFYMLLLAAFAAVALALSAIGIFGVTSYSITQRTGEIGIRLALGAAPKHVLGLIVRQGVGMIAAGVGLGVLGALAATRLLESLLYGVSVTDASTFVLVPLLLTAVALFACYLPARRATKVDPIIAMRSE